MLPEVNLLPKIERQRSFFVIIFFILLLIWFTLIAFLALHYFTTKNSLENAQTNVQQLTEIKTNLQERINDVESAHSKAFVDAVHYAEEVTFPTSALIDNLFILLPDHAYLSKYAYDEGKITIQTQFETMDVAAMYVSRLVGSDYIRDVKVDEIRTFSLYGEGVGGAPYTTIPRYDVTHSLEANIKKLKGEENDDD